MEIKLGRRKFDVRQTWDEMKAFNARCDELEAEMAEAREAKAAAEMKRIGEALQGVHEAQVRKCLKSINGDPFSPEDSIGDLEWNEVTAIALRLQNPQMELLNRVPFEGETSEV